MISKPTVARILEACRIEEVVGDYLALKKRGVNYIARCPFHNEKTPSFNVNPVRNIYKCFGCGKGGDSVNFIMEHEKLSYPEALRHLARKYNIEIEESYDRDVEEEKKLEKERESLFTVSAYAQKYFEDALWNSDEGRSVGLSYFRERGLSDDVIRRFGLGYAPEGRTVFTNQATKEGYNIDYLVKSGLTIRIEPENSSPDAPPSGEREGVKHYDRFAGRVMFPIYNITGRIIGFGGRALKKEVKAKYVNSPESEIYHKSNVLYGMNLARKTVATEDNCFLVEGYMDVISMHTAGIENAVASSGTSLTVEQIRLIKRYTENITIMYDGDAAGIKASFRGIDMILEEGLNVRVVLFPEGHDPDSYSRQHSSEEVKSFIQKNTTDFIRFKTQLLWKDAENDPIKRAELIKEIVTSIALIPSAITRTVFIQECSRIMKMDEQALLTELNKILRKKYAKRNDEPLIEEIVNLDAPAIPQPADAQRDTAEFHEKELIRLLLNFGDRTFEYQVEDRDDDGNPVMVNVSEKVSQFIVEHLQADQMTLEHPAFSRIFNEYASETIPPLEHFLHHPDAEISRIAIDLTTSPYSLSDWKNKHGIVIRKDEDAMKLACEHAVYSFKVRKLLQAITETQKELEHATDDEDILTLVAKKKMLDDAKNAFSKALGWVIIR